MTDQPLFNLDSEERWRLVYDQRQWIIQYRKAKKTGPGAPETGTAFAKGGRRSTDEGWRGRSFVNGKKSALWRLFRELGILLTEEAVQRVDSMPETFCHFILQHDPKTAQRNPCIREAMSDMQRLSTPHKGARLTESVNNSDERADTPQKLNSARAKGR